MSFAAETQTLIYRSLPFAKCEGILQFEVYRKKIRFKIYGYGSGDMADDQAAIKDIDISERLRFLMARHRITVSEMAANAGVSKSAMEKYLAGPSSPRATAIASLCVALEVNAHWLLFGEPDNDLSIIQRAVEEVVVALLNELKQDTALADDFLREIFGTTSWRMFTWDTGNTRAGEAIQMITRTRQKDIEDAASGLCTARLSPIPMFPDEADSSENSNR